MSLGQLNSSKPGQGNIPGAVPMTAAAQSKNPFAGIMPPAPIGQPRPGIPQAQGPVAPANFIATPGQNQGIGMAQGPGQGQPNPFQTPQQYTPQIQSGSRTYNLGGFLKR